jgi:predicted MFS family arabinose efflux permease
MLTSTVGIGAICGGAWMLLRPALTGLTSVVMIATALMSLAVLAFTASGEFYMALPCVFIAGSAMTITGTGAQTLIQASVDARMRGRVMALYGMIFRAGPAMGAVIMGSLSEHFGLRWPLAVGAMVSIAVWVMARMKQGQIAASLEDFGESGAPELVPTPAKRGT